MLQGTQIANVFFHHFGLRVADARACRDWYVETFGLVSVREFSANGLDFILLAVPGSSGTALEFIGGGDGLKPMPYENVMQGLSQLGFPHVSLQVEDLDAVMAKVRQRGIAIGMDVIPAAPNSGGAKIAFVSDPWGNVIELLELA